MATVKISALPVFAGPVAATDIFPMDPAGAAPTSSVTAALIKTFTSASPTLVTPDLGTPSAGVATNLTGTAAGLTAGVASAVAVGGITGLGTGVATALAINVGSAGAPVVLNGAGGTPSSLTGTNITGSAAGLTSGITLALKSATTTVDVSAATAPTSGQVLTATAGTTATWQTPSGGGITIGTTAITSGTGGRLLYETSGNVVGEISGATSDGTLLTLSNLLTITQASANAGILASTGYSLTGSNATSMIDLAGTWNTSGAPTAIKLNMTNTASGSALLLDLQIASATLFNVSKAGLITSNVAANAQWLSLQYAASEYVKIGFINSVGYGIGAGSVYGSTKGGIIFAGDAVSSVATTVNIGSPTLTAFAVFNTGSNTTPAVSFPRLGLTTKPAIFINQTTATTALPFEIQLNDVNVMNVTPNGDIKARTVILGGGGVTVANLPAAVQGGTNFVTDSTTTLALGLGLTVAGGGANKVPVYSDGTNWIIG